MNNRVCTCVVLLAGVMQAAAHAQPNARSTPAPTVAEPDLRDKPEGLIHLDVMVTDAQGHPASGLLASHFRLTENGRAQKILSFQGFTGEGAGTEPPVNIVLLIDTLDESPELARDERNAVLNYLRKDGGRLARPTSVFQLSETGLWAVGHPSSDGISLARQLEHNDYTLILPNSAGERGPVVFSNRQPGPAAAQGLALAAQFVLAALGQIATDERRLPGRKLLLWIGPDVGTSGDQKTDPGLFGTICWFSTLLREAHLALYSFSVGETGPRLELYKDYPAGVASRHRASAMSLNRNVLAVQSGGRVIDAGADIENEIEKCVQEAGRFYRISFDPFPAGHEYEYHDLKLDVDQPELQVRTNSGYYDQPYYSIDQIPPLKPISFEEVQTILELDESDEAKAGRLTGRELTQRLSERRLALFDDIAHGKRTREQLRILADASSFLDPPSDEVPNDSPPNADEQRHMLSMMSEYLATAIHKLPDYFARRVTTRYQETALYDESDVSYKPLHKTDSATTTVRYRNGREDTDAKFHWLRLGSPELITFGLFGPALQDVLKVISKNGGMTWVRWELVAAGRAAVFRAAIPTDDSLRFVWACCMPDGDGNQVYKRYAGYRTEIAIDPVSGAILRASFQFDLKSTMTVTRSDIMIEYGPLEIGGKTYYCPQRSVSVSRGRSIRVLTDFGEFFRSFGPYTTMLNDVTFDRYHVFRSESRILTGFTPTEK